MHTLICLDGTKPIKSVLVVRYSYCDCVRPSVRPSVQICEVYLLFLQTRELVPVLLLRDGSLPRLVSMFPGVLCIITEDAFLYQSPNRRERYDNATFLEECRLL